MFIILFITVIIVAGGVLSIVYIMTYNTMMEDIKQRAFVVKDHILENLNADDLIDIGTDSPQGVETSKRIQEIFEALKGAGNLSRLYITSEDGSDEPVTTLTGNVYTIFWPVSDQDGRLIGTVGMEFDVSMMTAAHRQTIVYSLGLSGALLVLISVIAFLSMNRATEPFYKKLAYTDILTGYENRMAFEHKLRECGDIAERGTNVALIICDVNNLKTINDNIGHDAGDTYIQNTADLIFGNLGGKQPLYRIGGDEFASVFVGKKESEVLAVMRSLANEKRPAFKTQPFNCACGYALFNKDIDEDLRDTFKRADVAMYMEKKKQKGLV